MPDILVNIVDERATISPEALYAEIPRSATSFKDGYRKVTYEGFAKAINGVAWWLKRTVGRSEGFETLAYIGPNDLRYNVFVLGAVKAGYKLLLTSPRNSVAAHVNLFHLLGCSKLLAADTRLPSISTLAVHHEIAVIKVPSLEEILGSEAPHYPYTKTFAEASNDPCIALHTSGSTGLPKPLVISHAFLAAYLDLTQLTPPAGFESRDRLLQGNRLLFMLPPFHAANHCVTLCNAIFHGTVIIYPLSGAIPTAQVLVDALTHTAADVALVPPTLVAELGKDLSLLEFVADRLDVLIYAGGDVPQAMGREVATRMKLVNIYGVSELGVPPQINPVSDQHPDDWKDLSFHPDSGVEFEKYSDNLYELYVPAKPASKLQQPVFTLYPNIERFSPGDLFTSHPSEYGRWTYSGRKDDIIVFLTGEKTNPTSMEELISCHEEVRSALVVGERKFQAALLVEFVTEKALTKAEQADVIERLWPTVQEANRQCPKHAQIDKEHILIVAHDKPMLRSGKGTVQRRPTVALYAREIDALFEAAEQTTLTQCGSSQKSFDASDIDSISRMIYEIVTRLMGWRGLDQDDNLFELGMDSLQATLLARGLRQEFASSDIAIGTVYSNPSVSSLARKINDILIMGQQSESAQKKERQEAISSMVEEYRLLIDGVPTKLRTEKTRSIMPGERASMPAKNLHTVVLTGSTGHLGSYLLRTLVDSLDVAQIYCLDRTIDANSRRARTDLDGKLQDRPNTCRITRLMVDLSREHFGLDEEVYYRLLEQTTVIIHNAWPVNFNLPLSAFKPQIAGIVQLAHFAASATQHPICFFISSISSVLGYAGDGSMIPESIITDASAASPMGYAESKLVAEVLLDHASKRLNIDVRVARVGQIAGPAKSQGSWNMWEWFPRLVLSSLHVGAVPDSLGPSLNSVDWLPIDLLAEILLELLLQGDRRHSDSATLNGDGSGGGTPACVYHLLNPRAVEWTTLLPSISSALAASRSSKGNIEIVSLGAWIRRVRASAEACDGGDVEAMLEVNPAAKILGFFEGLEEGNSRPRFALTETMRASSTLREMEGIKTEWLERWLKQWLVSKTTTSSLASPSTVAYNETV